MVGLLLSLAEARVSNTPCHTRTLSISMSACFARHRAHSSSPPMVAYLKEPQGQSQTDIAWSPNVLTMTDTVEFPSFTKIMEKKTQPKLKGNHCNYLRRKKRREVSSKVTEHNDQFRFHFHWAIFGVTYLNCYVTKVVTERTSTRKSCPANI